MKEALTHSSVFLKVQIFSTILVFFTLKIIFSKCKQYGSHLLSGLEACQDLMSWLNKLLESADLQRSVRQVGPFQNLAKFHKTKLFRTLQLNFE